LPGQQFDDYLVNGYYLRRKEVLATDLYFLKNMHKVTERQEGFTQQDLTLSEDELKASQLLFDEKVISQHDLRDMQSKLVAKQMVPSQLQSQLLTNENQQADKQRDIDELAHTIMLQIYGKTTRLSRKTTRLYGKSTRW
jgi:hypothetical protein